MLVRLQTFLFAVVLGVGCSSDDDCAGGMKKHRVCVQCGPAGGCARYADQCARECETEAHCDDLSAGISCVQGVCQLGMCI
jgi:hypothetical protein